MKVRKLMPELKKRAEDELNEVPCNISENLIQLRTWLNSQPHINARTDDQWLLAFLRGSKFRLDDTMNRLETFYTMRATTPEFFSNRDPFEPKIQEVLSSGAFWIPLPKTARPAAPRVLILGCSSLDPNKVHVFNAMKVNLMVLDILMNEDDNFSVAGIHLLQSLEAIRMGYLFQMSPRFVKQASACLHQSYPVRTKSVHLVKAPFICEAFFNLVRSFLSSKLKERVKVRSSCDFSNIHEDIPLSILPSDYGGDEDSIEQLAAIWKKKIESYSDWFKDDAKYGVYRT